MSLINVSNLTFGYEGSADNVFENISFSINSDWKLGMTGRNGRGKTTFLKLLMNKYEYSGSITQGESFEYFPYNNFDEYEITGDIIGRISAAEPWQIERELSLLGVDAEALYRPFCTLSNGERTKALIAGLFLKQNSFLLIDEPTNHLDEAGRKTLAEYLNRKKGFILVSHDRNFLDACVDHILAVNKTSVEVIRGNFSTWQYEKNLRDSFETERNERLRRDIKKLEAASRRTADWSDRVEKTKKGARNGEGKPDRGFIGHKAAKMMKRSKAIENRREAAAEEKSRLLKDIEENESLKISPLNITRQGCASLEI